jgi:serine/threonine-protein kinase
LDEVIGHGGMGVVYKAHQLHLDRPVALKLIVPQYAHDSSYRERFERESRIAASIGHANVIPVFDAGEDDGLLYIVMQLVDGIDLDKLLRGLGPLEPAEAVRVLEQLASALDAAHGRGLVHRDVKPANVLIGSNNSQQVCLTDFGLAKYAEATSVVREIEQWAGTIDYLAPEQIEGGPVDRRADIYALTAVFYHCLTGLIPFARDSDAAKLWAHINAPRPSAADARRGVPPAIDHVIARGMAKSPDERYESAGGLAAAAAAVFGLRATRIGLSPDRIAGFPPQGDNVPTRDAGPTV